MVRPDDRAVLDDLKLGLWRLTVCNRSAPARAIERLVQRRALTQWEASGRVDPPPAAYKHQVIREYAARYNLRSFIETGTYLGDTTDALHDDFETLVTIELDPRLARDCRRRLGHRQHVTVLEGDSGALVPEILQALRSPALFWLDAHYSGGVTAHGAENSPLAKELQSILTSSVLHVVLIDDARLLGVRDGYPHPARLAELAETHGRQLSIEHDIARVVPPAVSHGAWSAGTDRGLT
jgi:hypothetical protein